MSAGTFPRDIPSRAELWRRLQLARSLVEHRAPSPETRRIVQRALDGADITTLTDTNGS